MVPAEDLDKNYVEIAIEGDTVLPQEQAASLMSAFWERGYTECNLAKAISVAQMGKESKHEETDAFRALAEDTGPRIKLGRKVERERSSPESLS